MGRLIAIIVFLDILFFALSAYYLRKDRRGREKSKLIRQLTPDDASDSRPLLKTERKRTRLEHLAAGVMDLAVLESLLISAQSPLSMERFLSLSIGTALLLVLPVIVLLRNPVAAVACAAVGLMTPFFYLIRCRRLREQALVQQLPDTLEMIVRALRIGQSVDGALKEVAASSPAPVGTEFRLVYEEMAMGLSFEHALTNFEKRFTRVTDVKIMCTAFIVQRETGGNLTRILSGLAATIRERFQLKRQVRALTAEGRTSALILGLLPLFFAAITYLFNPRYIDTLVSHPAGRKLLILAAAFVAVGFAVMRLMTRIEV